MMEKTYSITFLSLCLISMGFFVQESHAQIINNEAYLVEGGGFAVTDESIKTSQIDLLLSTKNQIGSKIPISIEDGFITLNNDDFGASDLSGTLLMGGRFLTIVGEAQTDFGNDARVNLVGKLIQHSEDGSVYGFTGKVTQGFETNKIIYTAKISKLTTTINPEEQGPKPTTTKSNEMVVHILKGASERGFGVDYRQAADLQRELQKTTETGSARANYFLPSRLTIIPGTTITFINEDTVSHSITSGKRDTNSRGGTDYVDDGKINSGEIKPGGIWSVTINDIGFIFLYDKNYPWMTMDMVSFPDLKPDVIRRAGQNQIGN